MICAATDIIDIIFNFIALAILNDFDNFVFASLKNESFKELIERNFVSQATKIKHTTSKKCDVTEMSEVKDEEGEMRPLRVLMSKRDGGNKALFLAYKVLRSFYCAIVFYFLPFMSIILSVLVPTLCRGELQLQDQARTYFDLMLS